MSFVPFDSDQPSHQQEQDQQQLSLPLSLPPPPAVSLVTPAVTDQEQQQQPHPMFTKPSSNSDYFLPHTWTKHHHQPPQQQYQQLYYSPSPSSSTSSSSDSSGQYHYGTVRLIRPAFHLPNYASLYDQSGQQQQQQDPNMRRPQRKRRRPPHSYASMIAQAILTSPDHRLTLREIYDYVQNQYQHMYEANEPGWQNTIRHNLSLNRCFYKQARSAGKAAKGKGGYWCVDIKELNNTTFGSQILASGVHGQAYPHWHQGQSTVGSSSKEDADYNQL